MSVLTNRLLSLIRCLFDYGPARAGLGALFLYLLNLKSTSIAHEISGFLPPPPPPVPLSDGFAPLSDMLPQFVVFLAGGIYLAAHFRPNHNNDHAPTRSLVAALSTAVVAWILYCFMLPTWLACEYEGERYLVGLYFTDHGRIYSASHTCDQVLADHAGRLGKVMTPTSLALGKAAYALAFMIVLLLFEISIILMFEVLVKAFKPPVQPNQ